MQVRVTRRDCSLTYIFSDTSRFEWRLRADSHELSLNAGVTQEKLVYGMVRGS